MRKVMRKSMRNKVRTVWLKGVAAIVLCALPVLAQHGSSTVVNPYTSPEHEQAGAKLFRAQCAGCHGPDGTGTGAGASLASGTFVHGGSDEAAIPHHLKRRAGHHHAGVFIQRHSDLAARHSRPRTCNRARRKPNQGRPSSRRRDFSRELFPLPCGCGRGRRAERPRPHRRSARDVPMPNSVNRSAIPTRKSLLNTGRLRRPHRRDARFAAYG